MLVKFKKTLYDLRSIAVLKAFIFKIALISIIVRVISANVSILNIKN